MNLLQWERAVAVATMTARERLAPGGGSALMRASGRHPGGRVAGGEGLLAGLIHDVPLVLARHFVGNLRSLLLAVAVLLALALRRALRHARCLSPTKGENRGRPEVTGITPPSLCTLDRKSTRLNSSH